MVLLNINKVIIKKGLNPCYIRKKKYSFFWLYLSINAPDFNRAQHIMGLAIISLCTLYQVCPNLSCTFNLAHCNRPEDIRRGPNSKFKIPDTFLYKTNVVLRGSNSKQGVMDPGPLKMPTLQLGHINYLRILRIQCSRIPIIFNLLSTYKQYRLS